MPGLFQGLEAGKRALLTHQASLQTIGHNIANVNTPGFSRQRVNIVSSLPETTTQGVFGTGVDIADIRNIRDQFLTAQYRDETKSEGQWAYKDKILSEIEALFNEPGDNNLSTLLNDFWATWGDLSTDSSSSNPRTIILSKARALANGFHELADQLNQLKDSVDSDIVSLVEEVNRYSGELAKLNQQIKTIELGNEHANDLRDERDRLIDELSQLVDANVREMPNGEVTVYIGAMSVVNGSQTIDIDTKVELRNGQPFHTLVWKGTDIELKNINGQLKGLVDARDEMVPRHLARLNELTRSLVEEVNAIHRTGYALDGSTGNDFFDASAVDAYNLRIDPDIDINLAKIAASGQPDSPGDNSVALAIFNLQNTPVLESNTASINDFYNSLVGSLGVESHEAKSFSANFELLAEQLDYNRQAVQGVSLDEEMTNMLKFQHAYEAAARVITAMDEALDVVIRGMGIVGR